MNEEEILRILKDETEYPPTVFDIEKAIECLLELYQKQKKEIEKLKGYIETSLIPKSTINYLYVSKDKIRELQQEIHIELDKNAITRGYQLIIDDKFKKLLEESE